jgi:hypothetical protein
MKRIFLGLTAIALMASTNLYAANGGGKKKAKKKAKTECKVDKSCDKSCDPANCDPTCCDMQACPKDKKCTPAPVCTGK